MGDRTLLAASGGGHLKQLTQLVDRIPWAQGSRVWCTVDTPQSRSLLADEDEVIFVRSANSRDALAAAQNARTLRSVIRGGDFTHAVSTGASLAVSALPMARAAGASCHYVESAARVHGPSLSGRMLSPVPGVRRYTQYRTWARRGWRYAGSVFDAFQPGEPAGAPRLDRVVVTVGTLDRFPFRAMVERLARLLPSETEVLWQTGCTDVSGLGIEATPSLPASELAAHSAGADLVIAHAGVGSALSALESGRIPILVPRRARRGEHVDDHQEQIARELSERGLARWVEVEHLTLDVLLEASMSRLSATSEPPVLDLRDR